MIEFSQLNLNTPLQPIKENLFKKKKKYCFPYWSIIRNNSILQDLLYKIKIF